MSFILDALKKSENERQKQDTPGIASIPESGRRYISTKWLWLIAALLVVNVAVVSGFMLRGGDGPEAVAATPPDAAKPATATFSELVSEAKRSQPPVADPTPPTPALDAVQTVAMPPPTAEPVPTVTDGLATFNELRAQGVLQLPDMHLDIHVYSGQPEDRFVFVNMSKYKERATLAEGPVIREITPDGVVLVYSGTAFLLPRE